MTSEEVEEQQQSRDNKKAVAVVSRECITCDAEGCGKSNPTKQCSRCKMAFYCNAECQKAHWRTHKPGCIPIDTMREKLLGLVAEKTGSAAAPLDAAAVPDEKRTCGVCLEEDMSNPIVLPSCRHVFCFPCLARYQGIKGAGQAATCPYCRSEMPDIRESTASRAAILAARAGRKAIGEDERKELCQQASAGFQKILDLGDEKDVFAFAPARAEIMRIQGDVKGALEIMEGIYPEMKVMASRRRKIVEAMQRADALMASSVYNEDEVQEIFDKVEKTAKEGLQATDQDLIDTALFIARLYGELEDWDGAMKFYTSLVTDFPAYHMMTAPQHRQIFMGLSKCWYGKGDYQGAIDTGEAAIVMNRFFPQIHKYVALAYKAKGDMEMARKVASQAVIYETPWDDENKAECRRLWEELME